GGLHARGPRRLQRAAWVVQPDVDALDQEPPDPHVVVLEDEDPSAELPRARALEDLLDDALTGAVRRMRLAGEDQLDGPLLVPQEAGEPVDVVEDQAGALVGREAPGEADRQDVRVQGGLELGEDRGSLPVAGELIAQAPAGEDRQLALLAGVGLPELFGRDLVEPLPEAPAFTRLVDVVEVD